MKAFKGWRTVIFNIATLGVLASTAFTGATDDPNVLKALVFVGAAGNLLLRWLTTTKVGSA